MIIVNNKSKSTSSRFIYSKKEYTIMAGKKDTQILEVALIAAIFIIYGLWTIFSPPNNLIVGILETVIGLIVGGSNKDLRNGAFSFFGSLLSIDFSKKTEQNQKIVNSPNSSQSNIGEIHAENVHINNPVTPQNQFLSGVIPQVAAYSQFASGISHQAPEEPKEPIPQKELNNILKKLQSSNMGTRTIGLTKLNRDLSDYIFPNPSELVQALVVLLKEDSKTQGDILNYLRRLVWKKEARETVISIALKPVSEIISTSLNTNNLQTAIVFLFDTESDNAIPAIKQCILVSPKDQVGNLWNIFSPSKKDREFIENLAEELTKFQEELDEPFKTAVIDIVKQLHTSGPPW